MSINLLMVFYKFLDSYVDSFLFPSNLIAKASKLSNKRYRVIYLGCDNGRYRFNAAKIDSKGYSSCR